MEKNQEKQKKKVENKKLNKIKEDKEVDYKILLEEKNNEYLRLLAEFENFRKRQIEEHQRIKDSTISSFVEEILPILDNFELSLKMTDNKEMFIKGIEILHSNLVEHLKKNKIESFIPKIGEPFNSKEHLPLLVENKNAKHEEILGIVSKGYKFKDKILLPAKVQVKKKE